MKRAEFKQLFTNSFIVPESALLQPVVRSYACDSGKFGQLTELKASYGVGMRLDYGGNLRKHGSDFAVGLSSASGRGKVVLFAPRKAKVLAVLAKWTLEDVRRLCTEYQTQKAARAGRSNQLEPGHFCKCGVGEDEDFSEEVLVGCDGDGCINNGWCHPSCVGVSDPATLPDVWFCPDCVSTADAPLPSGIFTLLDCSAPSVGYCGRTEADRGKMINISRKWSQVTLP